jgi:hypothetical protein
MRKSKRRGLLLAPDDLTVGKYVAIHSAKGSNVSLAFSGVASEVMAINLPFVVLRPGYSEGTITEDVRHVNLMAVTDDFVRAQAPHEQGIGQEKPPVNAGEQGV